MLKWPIQAAWIEMYSASKGCPMPHDVFICYATNDAPVAERICLILEARQLSCWIAPRNVPAGEEWAGAVVDAIENAKAMVLVFSEHSNTSAAVRKELDRAFNCGIPVFPFRIREVEPSGSVALYIAGIHWIDAFLPPIEQKIGELAVAILAMCSPDSCTVDCRVATEAVVHAAERDESTATSPSAVEPACSSRRLPRPASPVRHVLVTAVAIALVAAAMLSGLLLMWEGLDSGGQKTVGSSSLPISDERPGRTDIAEPQTPGPPGTETEKPAPPVTDPKEPEPPVPDPAEPAPPVTEPKEPEPPVPDPAEPAPPVTEPKELQAMAGSESEMRLVRIPAGSFRMGAPTDKDAEFFDEDARPMEQPQHLVTITQDYYLGEYEVTQQQYLEIMGEDPSWWNEQNLHIPSDKFPVALVTWNEADEFCRKLSQREERTYRLPTEAEWEYACRAGAQTRFPNGKRLEDLMEIAIVAGEDSNPGSPLEGGRRKPNDFGLYDILGNVREFCADWYGDYGSDSVVDPQGPASGEKHVVRGGCYHFIWTDARCTSRFPVEEPAPNVGFRVLSEIPTQDQSYLDYINSRSPLPAKVGNVYLLPLGEFSQTQQEIIEGAADFLRKSCNLQVITVEQLPLSQLPADARRDPDGLEQISTKYLLHDYLGPSVPEDAAFYIAITSSDLWPGEDGFNFVLGDYFPSKRVGVWSIQRYGDPGKSHESHRACLLRTTKMGSWIACHLLSMETCRSYKCTLNHMSSVDELDAMPLWLCPRCLAKLCWATKPDLEKRLENLAEFCKNHGLNDEEQFYETSRGLISEE